MNTATKTGHNRESNGNFCLMLHVKGTLLSLRTQRGPLGYPTVICQGVSQIHLRVDVREGKRVEGGRGRERDTTGDERCRLRREKK